MKERRISIDTGDKGEHEVEVWEEGNKDHEHRYHFGIYDSPAGWHCKCGRTVWIKE